MLWKPQDDWYHESNIQERIKDYLTMHWGKPVHASDANTKERGPDLLFQNHQLRLRVEIKRFGMSQIQVDDFP